MTSPSTSLPRRGPWEVVNRVVCVVGTAIEQATEDVAEPASRIAEQVVNRWATRPGTAPREAETAAAKQPARLVVLLALGLIRQHVVGFGDFLEAPFGRGVARVLVGMVIPRQLAIGLFDLLGVASLETPRTL